MKTNKGFTLIELLIVIAIIGILATALLPTILNAPAKARDTSRELGIMNVITAIEAYNADNGKYPQVDGCIDGGGTAADPFGTVVGNYFSGGITPTDPSGSGRSIPTGVTDPGGCVGNGFYYYSYLADTTDRQYLVATIMELNQNNNTDVVDDDSATACTDECDFFVEVR